MGRLATRRRARVQQNSPWQELTTNAISIAALLTLIAQQFEQQRSGTIAVISSVAGDRGRASKLCIWQRQGPGDCIYLGNAPAAVEIRYVAVITIKPGFVDTPMTAAFPKGPLWAKPQNRGSGHRPCSGPFGGGWSICRFSGGPSWQSSARFPSGSSAVLRCDAAAAGTKLKIRLKSCRCGH